MSIYSLKMRASKHTGSIQEHVSGAEKILPQQELPQQMEALLSRALHHAKGKADFINLKIEAVAPENLKYIEALFPPMKQQPRQRGGSLCARLWQS